MKIVILVVKGCLEVFGMLKKELFFSLLFALETLRKLLPSGIKCAVKSSTLTASHCVVFNIVNIIRMESF